MHNLTYGNPVLGTGDQSVSISFKNVEHLLCSKLCAWHWDEVINWLIQCLEAPGMCPVLNAKQILKPYSVPSTMMATGNKDPLAPGAPTLSQAPHAWENSGWRFVCRRETQPLPVANESPGLHKRSANRPPCP